MQIQFCCELNQINWLCVTFDLIPLVFGEHHLHQIWRSRCNLFINYGSFQPELCEDSTFTVDLLTWKCWHSLHVTGKPYTVFDIPENGRESSW